MIIAIDIDEVLADSITNWRNYAKNVYCIEVSDEELGKIPYLSFLGNSNEEISERIRVFNNSEHFYKTKPVEGAQDAVDLLSKDHTLKIVTSRPFGIKEQTIEWIEKYFPGKFSEIHFNNETKAKSYSLGDGRHKGEMLEELGTDVFIDDYIEYVNGCPKHIKAILLDKPWNQGKLDSNVTRVNNWPEIIKKIQSISG
jgi:uncharacterized HAD superfamily protein